MNRHASLNKAYRTVWNHLRQCYMVVGENAKSRGKTSSRKVLVEAVTAALLAMGAGQVMAADLPWTGDLTNSANMTGSVVANSATFTGSFTNTGTIAGSDGITVTNSSTITGSISNSGLISSQLRVDNDSQASGAIINSGSIAGRLNIYGPVGGFTNSGTIGTSSIWSHVLSVANGNVLNDAGGLIQSENGLTLQNQIGSVSNAGTIIAEGTALQLEGRVSGGFTNTGTINSTLTVAGNYGLFIDSSPLIAGVAAINILSGTISGSGGAAGKNTGIRIRNSNVVGSTNAIYTDASATVGDIYIQNSVIDGKLSILSTRDGAAGTNVTLSGNDSVLALHSSQSTIAGDLNVIGYREKIRVDVTSPTTTGSLSVAGTATFGNGSGSDGSFLDLSLASGHGIVAGNTLTGLITAGTLSGDSNLSLIDNSVLLDFTKNVVGSSVNAVAQASAGSCAGSTVSGNVADHCEIGFDRPFLTIASGATISGGTVTGYGGSNYGILALPGSYAGSITNQGTLSIQGGFGIALEDTALTGNIVNDGRIATSTTVSGKAISLNNSTLTGSIINNASGVISNFVSAAIAVSSSTITGGITNSGVIQTDSGTRASISINSGSLVMSGIHNLSGGTISGNETGVMIDEGGSVAGGLVNNGVISGSDVGVGISGTLSGGLTNSGLIHSEVGSGINLSSSVITGGIVNNATGTISSGTSGPVAIYLTSSSISGGIINRGLISGDSAAIRLYSSQISDGITNYETGTIEALANSGVAIDVTESFSTISGGINNLGLISGGRAGISVDSQSLISGGITNSGTSGTISGDVAISVATSSLISGGITNSGTISGSGSAISVFGTLDSIHVKGNNTANFSGGIYAPSTLMFIDSGHSYIKDDGDDFTVSNFTNNGTFKVGANNTGTIVGDFTNNGTFSPAIASMSSYGKLIVDGNISLGGTLLANNIGATGLVDGTLSGVIHHTGSRTGQFATVTGANNLFTWTADYQANDVDLVLSSGSGGSGGSAGYLDAVTTAGNTPASGAARALDSISADDPTNPVVLSFLNVPQDEVSDAVSQTLPLQTGGMSQSIRNSLRGTNRIIQARQEGQHGRSSGDEFFGDQHAWFKPFGSWTDQDDRKGVTGFDANTYGMVFGADAEISDSKRLGVAFSYARSNIDSNSNVAKQTADVNSYQLALYGSHNFSDVTDINFQFDIGKHDNEGLRDITFAGTRAKSDYSSWSAHLGAGLAHSYTLSDKTTLTPSVRADYTRIRDESYNERGAGALNLRVNSNTTEELVLGVDGKLAHALTDTATFTANLGLGYDVINEQASLTSAFAGAPSVSFTTKGLDPSPWLMRGGLGVVSKATETVEISARYDIEARKDFDNQTASVKVRWAF